MERVSGGAHGESRSTLSTQTQGELVAFLRGLVRSLNQFARRKLQAAACQEFANGSPRFAESVFGWNQNTVMRGLQELSTSDSRANPDATSISSSPSRVQKYSGRQRVEQRSPELLEATQRLVDKKPQADPKMLGTRLCTRITGSSLRRLLAEDLGIAIERIPSSRSIRRMLNRNGLSLRRLRTTIPKKKIPQVDAIFQNVHTAHERAKLDPTILRISIDNKAKVKLGPFDRGGKTREPNQIDAADHDMGGDTVTPCGILEVVNAHCRFHRRSLHQREDAYGQCFSKSR